MVPHSRAPQYYRNLLIMAVSIFVISLCCLILSFYQYSQTAQTTTIYPPLSGDPIENPLKVLYEFTLWILFFGMFSLISAGGAFWAYRKYKFAQMSQESHIDQIGRQ